MPIEATVLAPWAFPGWVGDRRRPGASSCGVSESLCAPGRQPSGQSWLGVLFPEASV